MHKQRGDIVITAIIALVFISIIGGLGYKFWSSAEKAGRLACESELKTADQMLEAAADVAEEKAQQHITDMEAAYEVGQQEAAAAQRTYVTKGASDVTKYPVFNNTACVLPDDSLHNLNGARAGVRAATDTSTTPQVNGVRVPAPTIRWPHRDAVPTVDTRREAAQ